MFYRTDQYLDCKDNFSKLLSSVNSLLNGNKEEYKWVVIFLYMFLQSLFIIALINHSNKLSIIKKHYTKTINNKKLTLKLVHFIKSTDKAFTIKNNDDSTIIHMTLYFGSEKCFDELSEALKNLNIDISKNQVKALYQQANKLLSLSELFKKVKKIVTINENIDEYFQCLIELRNEFMHFPPKLWSIEKDLIKSVVLHCLKIASLLIKSDFIRGYKMDKNEMNKNLNKIIKDFRQRT